MELGLSRVTRLKNRSTELSVAVLSLTSLLYNLAVIKSAALLAWWCQEQSTDPRNADSGCAGPLSTFALRSGDGSEISSPGNYCPGSRACSLAGAQGSGQPRGHAGCLPGVAPPRAPGYRCLGNPLQPSRTPEAHESAQLRWGSSLQPLPNTLGGMLALGAAELCSRSAP